MPSGVELEGFEFGFRGDSKASALTLPAQESTRPRVGQNYFLAFTSLTGSFECFCSHCPRRMGSDRVALSPHLSHLLLLLPLQQDLRVGRWLAWEQLLVQETF